MFQSLVEAIRKHRESLRDPRFSFTLVDVLPPTPSCLDLLGQFVRRMSKHGCELCSTRSGLFQLWEFGEIEQLRQQRFLIWVQRGIQAANFSRSLAQFFERQVSSPDAH